MYSVSNIIRDFSDTVVTYLHNKFYYLVKELFNFSKERLDFKIFMKK